MSGPILWHWTCEHAAEGIRRQGVVVPHGGWSWWTDITQADGRTRRALGLTSETLDCDRMAYRFRAADIDDIMPWRGFVTARDLTRSYVTALESAPGAQPWHWWVATVDVPIRSVRRMVSA